MGALEPMTHGTITEESEYGPITFCPACGELFGDSARCRLEDDPEWLSWARGDYGPEIDR